MSERRSTVVACLFLFVMRTWDVLELLSHSHRSGQRTAMLRGTMSSWTRAASQLRRGRQLPTFARRTLASPGTTASLHTRPHTHPYTHARPYPPRLRAFSPVHQQRFLSQDSRTKIEAAVRAHPVVVFMKGTPAVPQCGFSRATMQVLDIQGVPPEKIKTYDVLADEELRTDIKAFS